jgi:hypothetical protein
MRTFLERFAKRRIKRLDWIETEIVAEEIIIGVNDVKPLCRINDERWGLRALVGAEVELGPADTPIAALHDDCQRVAV